MMRAIEAPFETVNQELAERVGDVGGEIESAVIWAVCELNWSRARKGHQAGQAPISARVLVRQPQPVINCLWCTQFSDRTLLFTCPEYVNKRFIYVSLELFAFAFAMDLFDLFAHSHLHLPFLHFPRKHARRPVDLQCELQEGGKRAGDQQ